MQSSASTVHNLLEAFLALEPNESDSRMEQAAVSLDERVEMLLRARHGSAHPFSSEQRAAARAWVLERMAAEVAEQIAKEKAAQQA